MNSFTGSAASGRRCRYGLALVPCAVILAYAFPIVGALLPNNFDELDESYEPAKTLALLAGSRAPQSNWGPMPNYIYAPVYAPLLYLWRRKGEFQVTTGGYPYGFRRPYEQQGMLILLARIVGLGVGLLAVAYYGMVLTRVARSRLAAAAALILCVATGPDVAFKFVTTKPDGLMLAFLTVSMAMYAAIVAEGLTVGRGACLAVSAVASLSCKEETAPAYIAMFAWLAVAGLRGEPAAMRRRFLGRYAATLAVGIGAYVLIDIVHAPAAWLAHVRFWTSHGTSSAIWAPPGYSWRGYFIDVGRGLAYNLGPAGSAALVAALFIAVVSRPKGILSAWVPTFGYLVLMVLSVRYMAVYFLLPVNILAAFPVALAFAHVTRSQRLMASPFARMTAIAVTLLLCTIGLWSGNTAWVNLDQLTPMLVERYIAGKSLGNQSVHLGNLWPQPAGVSRLSHLGIHVDDRALGELLRRPADAPDVILIDRGKESWLRDFKAAPARDEHFKASGYSYAAFDGFESLGYRLAEVVGPPPRTFMRPIWRIWPWLGPQDNRELLVYRRTG